MASPEQIKKKLEETIKTEDDLKKFYVDWGSEIIHTIQETRREKAELRVLRRKTELRRLKKELGEDE